MVSDLRKIGVDFRKTYNIQRPKIDKELLPAYVRGYFDGDGTISKKIDLKHLHNVNIGIVGFENNIDNFQAYLSSQGIDTHKIYDRRPEKYKTNEPFVSLMVTDKRTKNDFLHFIYDDASVYLDRKYELAKQY